ncbi:MAG: glycosyltransferase [Desulfobulbaceae bacterium]|nr:glycosyltransferase [Desulfobulbaceae bacterium]HIJ77959.1 glycosyltransferase [Deltaproteobacteria bacterium]
MTSIIICFYERLQHLRYCLDSLKFSQDDFDEVVISDDGSSLETVEALTRLIKSYDFPIRHVWQPKNGFRVAAARNNGIRNAKGDYLIFFDCDFLVLPGTVKEHTRRAQKGRFVAGNCKYLSAETTEKIFNNQLQSHQIERLYNSIPDDNLRKEHRKFLTRTFFMRLHLLSPRKQSLGGHFSIHRDDIEKINGYDENYVGWGGEDEDLGIRLVMAGIYCRTAITHAKILHMWHPKQINNVKWQEGPNIRYFSTKNKPSLCENGLKNKGKKCA